MAILEFEVDHKWSVWDRDEAGWEGQNEALEAIKTLKVEDKVVINSYPRKDGGTGRIEVIRRTDGQWEVFVEISHAWNDFDILKDDLTERLNMEIPEDVLENLVPCNSNGDPGVSGSDSGVFSDFQELLDFVDNCENFVNETNESEWSKFEDITANDIRQMKLEAI